MRVQKQRPQVVEVPRMGGMVRMKVAAEASSGRVDIYSAPLGARCEPPLPVRVVPNVDGADVLCNLARFPGQPDEDWTEGLASMQRELIRLRARLESSRDKVVPSDAQNRPRSGSPFTPPPPRPTKRLHRRSDDDDMPTSLAVGGTLKPTDLPRRMLRPHYQTTQNISSEHT